jgi:very-short-patch-repair endonuclease/transcription elongation GreA/GreB family factor
VEERKQDELALHRVKSMLEYAEQLIKLDETVVKKLSQHRLPDQSHFIIHEHQLYNLPGVQFDQIDEDGPIWLRMERLIRTRPPAPEVKILEWVNVSNDPDKPCDLINVLRKRVTLLERDELIDLGELHDDEYQPSLKDEPKSKGQPQYFDLTLNLDRRHEIRDAADAYRAENWASWAEIERPRRKSILVYQSLFTIAQTLTAGNSEQSELVWGFGLSKWGKGLGEVDLPIFTRSVEIQILDGQKAEIIVRPRDLPCQIDLRGFQDLATSNYNSAEDTARKSLKQIENDESEGVSPFRAETFEPVLRLCASQLDPEGGYLPDQVELLRSEAVPSAKGEALIVSDRFVLFARRRTMNVVINDIERLKAKLTPVEGQALPKIVGATRTFVLGPSDAGDKSFVPLGNIGSMESRVFESEPEKDQDHSDLFFPKAFNEDQIAIVRRLETSDGVVVQGPPGTGKTHTIANIICHMLATGKRVLVVSHGETALAVIREQLPEKIRDLAISVTTSDRDGERQIENAVSLMLQIVNDYASNQLGPQKRIAEVENKIVQDRKNLNKIDMSIAKIAEQHLSNVRGTKATPFNLAKKLMAEKEAHSWLDDRPVKMIHESEIDTSFIEGALSARHELGDDLIYLDVKLPNVGLLPDAQTLGEWRSDLLRAKEFAINSEHEVLTRRIVSKLAVPRTEKLVAKIKSSQLQWNRLRSVPWANALFDKAINQDPLFLASRNYIEIIANEAASIGQRAQEYVIRSVILPNVLPPNDELQGIVGSLANGKNPFGLLSFKLNRYKKFPEEIFINGKSPNGSDDWRHISGYFALVADAEVLFKKWQSLCNTLGFVRCDNHSTLQDAINLNLQLAEALNLPLALKSLATELTSIAGDHTLVESLVESPEQLTILIKALEARLSQTRLAAVGQKVDTAKENIPNKAVPLNEDLREVLTNIDKLDANFDQMLALWDRACVKLDAIVLQRDKFKNILKASHVLSEAGGTLFAQSIKSKKFDDQEHLKHLNWQHAWDWWAQFSYLSNLNARDELKKLHDERLDTEKRLRNNFAELVRERAFYALAGTMPGQAKSALKAFSDLIRKLGKGTGKKAAMHRRELRSAMQKCYDAVPCWIMPAWRVSEQLPSEFESFDLVILDEASQSDAKELPALMRGKKVLIVGDDRQVSPSDAFIKQDDIERLRMNYLQDMPFPSHLLPGSSIYDLARVMFPDKYVMLKEHFRCVEPIIRFSMQFYSEPLLPLRVPTANERMDPPLVDILVKDGERHPKQKINQREAEVVVDEIAKIVENPTSRHIRNPVERARTIGVVSLIGSEQARHIQKLLIDRLGEQKFIEHRIVCGDSATMQGNERDIVFLSMVTGADGRIGAQTAEQYRRRFNVALSRAKDRMVLVRSIDEKRLNPNDLKAKVIRHFRDPMPTKASINENLVELCQSDFEREFFMRLAGLGYVVQPQVGSLGYSIDLVVEGANGNRLAIECDGDIYHGPDRWADDMRRQRILERVGWKFWRVFGSNYTLDPDGIFDDLIQNLNQLGILPSDLKASAAKWTEHREIEKLTESIVEKFEVVEVAASSILAVGDRVVLQYLDKPNERPIVFLITNDTSTSNPSQLRLSSPLSKRLAEVDVGDEFTFETASGEQSILWIAKQSAEPLAFAAE